MRYPTHIQLLAAEGKTSTTLWGVLSAVRLCERLELILAVVTPRHWAMAAGANAVY
jgi:hypothetical protein